MGRPARRRWRLHPIQDVGERGAGWHIAGGLELPGELAPRHRRRRPSAAERALPPEAPPPGPHVHEWAMESVDGGRKVDGWSSGRRPRTAW